MANELRFLDGDLLFVSGNLAMAEACCCDTPVEDSCDLSGTRPDEIIFRISSCNVTYNGDHLLTNAGDGTALNSATGYTPSGGGFGTICWAWWEATGILSDQYYIIAVDDTGDVRASIYRDGVCESYRQLTILTSDWSYLDGRNFGDWQSNSCSLCSPITIVSDFP